MKSQILVDSFVNFRLFTKGANISKAKRDIKEKLNRPKKIGNIRKTCYYFGI